MKTLKELTVGDNIWYFSHNGTLSRGEIARIVNLSCGNKEITIEGEITLVLNPKELDRYFIRRDHYFTYPRIYGTDLDFIREKGEEILVKQHEKEVLGILERLGRKLETLKEQHEVMKSFRKS